ncbi:beta-lactamase superfamily domain-containing protein [Lasiosphaeria miniovina]|uniref:Beta-lactamase superfamily domain-containing protein n=1 Tax=Lasiosphaeria miniovina TaxID=1954250 RepID=A0AA40DZ72_9PEZI|nr:beta-lactamase superfamily domain-containing protein [Lasiosphaeria miniovina]KAK0721969.1 beta-lactamase superfamily domain-containing protein [Lasiosphaeria miniovina]
MAPPKTVQKESRLLGKLLVPDTSNVKIPSATAKFLPSHAASTAALRSTWFGHASCYVELPSGFRTLFDPVFEERLSAMGRKRFTPAACRPGDFLALGAVFISHSHHDHLSLPSVKELVRAYPGVHFFVGLGLAKWFQDSGVSAATEMDWWDGADVVLKRSRASEAGVDAGQGVGNDNSSPPERISSGGKSVWFAGDTGYRSMPEGMEELGPGFDELPRTPGFTQIGSQ